MFFFPRHFISNVFLQSNFSSFTFSLLPCYFSTHVFSSCMFFFVRHMLSSTMLFFRPCFLSSMFFSLCYASQLPASAERTQICSISRSRRHSMGLNGFLNFDMCYDRIEVFYLKSRHCYFVKTIFSYLNQIYLYLYNSLSPISAIYNYAVLRDRTINIYTVVSRCSISVLSGPVVSQAFHAMRLWIDD